jgi:hypothetical protein
MRRTFGLALAAGLLAATALPTSSAHAQFSYGYDSFVYNVPSGASGWYSAGYSGIYTDQTTASFAGNSVAPFRGVAPYYPPPYGATFGRGSALPAYTPVVVTPAPARPVAVAPRRTLLRRLRGR